MYVETMISEIPCPDASPRGRSAPPALQMGAPGPGTMERRRMDRLGEVSGGPMPVTLGLGVRHVAAHSGQGTPFHVHRAKISHDPAKISCRPVGTSCHLDQTFVSPGQTLLSHSQASVSPRQESFHPVKPPFRPVEHRFRTAKPHLTSVRPRVTRSELRVTRSELHVTR